LVVLGMPAPLHGLPDLNRCHPTALKISRAAKKLKNIEKSSENRNLREILLIFWWYWECQHITLSSLTQLDAPLPRRNVPVPQRSWKTSKNHQKIEIKGNTHLLVVLGVPARHPKLSDSSRCFPTALKHYRAATNPSNHEK
jgi:hypothetical protein